MNQREREGEREKYIRKITIRRRVSVKSEFEEAVLPPLPLSRLLGVHLIVYFVILICENDGVINTRPTTICRVLLMFDLKLNESHAVSCCLARLMTSKVSV